MRREAERQRGAAHRDGEGSALGQLDGLHVLQLRLDLQKEQLYAIDTGMSRCGAGELSDKHACHGIRDT